MQSVDGLFFVRRDVVAQLFAVGIIWLLFQKLFVLDRGFVFHADGVVESRQTQVQVGFADGIEFDGGCSGAAGSASL